MILCRTQSETTMLDIANGDDMPDPHQQGNLLLTLPEVAARLRKTETALRWMMHQQTAPRSALIGGRRMFRASDVDAYISALFEHAADESPPQNRLAHEKTPDRVPARAEGNARNRTAK